MNINFNSNITINNIDNINICINRNVSDEFTRNADDDEEAVRQQIEIENEHNECVQAFQEQQRLEANDMLWNNIVNESIDNADVLAQNNLRAQVNYENRRYANIETFENFNRDVSNDVSINVNDQSFFNWNDVIFFIMNSVNEIVEYQPLPFVNENKGISAEQFNNATNKYVYNNNTNDGKDTKENDKELPMCSVCLCTFKNECLVAELKKCKHVFCEQCILNWSKLNCNCPMCRMPML
ncbi:hypothetical protein [Lambdina fiscellaria nucleopolyhedrovirus]|uniref:RING-type domain-containing protein n=1 Tax=Lambdina fiscellaria nucleopolyhedrovirus TaxID=1642929 RepID=A0A0E3Z7E6_9ABAC|nr:hypothetical protein [Lambdina fiscellaria nucleopolyhedrovirus]AKC91686.1 hypothetical protein [Lambdina fiscellaria nucleopolyhedrovirus]